MLSDSFSSLQQFVRGYSIQMIYDGRWDQIKCICTGNLEFILAFTKENLASSILFVFGYYEVI